MNKTLRLIAIGCISISLSACIPLVFVAGAAVGGAVIYDKRDVKTIAADHNIAQNLRKKIANNPAFKTSNIDITAFNKIILIVGQVPTQELKNEANTMAIDIPKVRRVYNEITISDDTTSAWQKSKDTGITTLVKSVLLATKGLRSSQIKVLTEDSVVYLMGIVTPRQAELASNAASTVSGVSKVVQVFELVR